MIPITLEVWFVEFESGNSWEIALRPWERENALRILAPLSAIRLR